MDNGLGIFSELDVLTKGYLLKRHTTNSLKQMMDRSNDQIDQPSGTEIKQYSNQTLSRRTGRSSGFGGLR